MSNPNITALTKQYEHATARLPETGHVHARKLTGAIARAAYVVDGIDKMHEAPSPTELVGAHQKKVMQAAVKGVDAITKIREWAHETLRDGLREIDARRDQKADLRNPHPLAAEIRVKVSSMSSGKVAALMGDLIGKNDGPMLAAILNAPEILTGIPAEMAQQFTQAFYAKNAPEELAEQQALMEMFETVLIATDIATKAAQSYSDPAKLAAIEKGEQSAADAAAEFARATI